MVGSMQARAQPGRVLTAHSCFQCSAARQEGLSRLGHTRQGLAVRGHALAGTSVCIDFLRPLKSQDRFIATVTVQKTSGARVQLLQTIVKVGVLR